MQSGQEPAYPAGSMPLPALLSLPACPRKPQPRAEGCCQVMVTQLENKCPAGSRGLGLQCGFSLAAALGGAGEATFSRGFWYLRGETASPP